MEKTTEKTTMERTTKPEPENQPPGQETADAYKELRKMAGAFMRRERSGHTLQPTALLHEAYIRIASQESAPKSRTHFMATASQMMKRILIDHARRNLADKRGGGATRTELSENISADNYDSEMVLAISEIIEELRDIAPRACHVTELKYFSGMANEEIAEHLDISLATVKREWTMAKTFLHSRLDPNSTSNP